MRKNQQDEWLNRSWWELFFTSFRLATASRRGKKDAWKAWAWGWKRLCFYFVKPLVTESKRFAKTQRLHLYAQSLLCQRTIVYYKGFCRSRKCHNFRQVSKFMMTWLIFTSFYSQLRSVWQGEILVSSLHSAW